MANRASHICSSLLFACAMGTADAAELGEAQLRSHIGQPLAASVELTMLEDAAAPVGVRLAHPDVYRGANIAMPAVLANLDVVVTRQGGRQFLHLRTLKPVESRHLHVYLDLLDGGRRTVRLVTLWLTPDPNPAPPLAAAPAPAAEALPPKAVPAARPAAALNDGEEYVEAGARRALAPLRQPPVLPRAAPARPLPARKAPAVPLVAHAAAVATPAAQQAPAACAAQPAAAQLEACSVLGEKNAALRQELGQLEAKVQHLQMAAGAAPQAAPAPRGAPRILKAKKTPPPEPDTPWEWIVAAVAACLALAGLALALLRRRRRSTFGKIPKEHKPARLPKAGEEPGAAPKPNFMAAVKARLMPGSRKAASPEPVEPALESAGD